MTHTIILSGYTATTGGNCWALLLGTWDSYGIEQIQLKLGQEWAGLVITATFTPPKGRKAVKVVVDSSGLFDVPQEATALAGQGTITFAGNTSGQQRISVDVPYVVGTHAAIDGVTPTPTPSEWEQFVAQVQQARDDAEAAAQAAEGSQAASAGSAAAAAQSAQEAQNIVDGAVQDITDAKNAAVQAVNDAGNAKVEEIEQINALVPTPTPEDAGKVVVVKPDGTGYELGDAGNKIDDTVVAPDTTWSSLNIVNKLCPPFSVTGDAVQFSPVEGYPLSVQSTIMATQEGTGDPSPTNVRPIVPVNEAGIWWIDGDNVLNLDRVELGTFDLYDGRPVESTVQSRTAYKIPCKKNAVLYQSNDMNHNLRVFVWSVTDSFVASESIASGGSYTFTVDGYFAIVSAVTADGGFAPNSYVGFSKTAVPYVGKDYTAPLPEPCYGGTVNLTDGTGEVTWGFIASYNGESLPGQWISDRDVYVQGETPSIGAAVAYQLATPTPFKIDSLSIPAPTSPATAYSTAGEITVEGRSDPIEYINRQIANAIAIAKV